MGFWKLDNIWIKGHGRHQKGQRLVHLFFNWQLIVFPSQQQKSGRKVTCKGRVISEGIFDLIQYYKNEPNHLHIINLYVKKLRGSDLVCFLRIGPNWKKTFEIIPPLHQVLLMHLVYEVASPPFLPPTKQLQRHLVHFHQPYSIWRVWLRLLNYKAADSTGITSHAANFNLFLAIWIFVAERSDVY